MTAQIQAAFKDLQDFKIDDVKVVRFGFSLSRGLVRELRIVDDYFNPSTNFFRTTKNVPL